MVRHSAGGKGVSIAQMHYLGRSATVLRDAVDEAFGRLMGGATARRGEAGNTLGLTADAG
ncbi:MAG TPA: hypothetical protein VEI02_12145 [Planctomycetota bacterium]|nr:hypothetical protein [Planctomycetota bacterium]